MGVHPSAGVLLVFLVALAGVAMGGAAAPVLPDQIGGFLSNERINVYTVGPDNVADVTGYVVGEEALVDIREGGVESPTINIFMTKRVAMHLEESDEPLRVVRDALDSGEMKIEGVGIKSGLKVSGFLEAIKRLAPEGGEEPPREVLPDTSIRDVVANIASRSENGTFVIGGESGLRYASVELSIPKLTVDDTAVIREYSGLGFNEVPQGVRRLPFPGKEEPLGRFVDLTLPDGVEWALIRFTYSDEELYSRNIREDDLRIKWYDEDTGFWVSLDEPGHPSWYLGQEWDRKRNVIGVKVRHASVYGIGGSIGPAQVPEKVMVRRPAPAAAEEGPQVQQVEVVEVATESPNWPVRIAVLAVIFLAALVLLLRLRKRGRAAETGEEPAQEVAEEGREEGSEEGSDAG